MTCSRVSAHQTSVSASQLRSDTSVVSSKRASRWLGPSGVGRADASAEVSGHRCLSSASSMATESRAAGLGLLYTQRTPLVYTSCMSMMRTNIEIEDDYVQAIMDRYGVRTKTAAVDLALRHLAGQPLTRAQALAMRGARSISEIPADQQPRSAA